MAGRNIIENASAVAGGAQLRDEFDASTVSTWNWGQRHWGTRNWQEPFDGSKRENEPGFCTFVPSLKSWWQSNAASVQSSAREGDRSRLPGVTDLLTPVFALGAATQDLALAVAAPLAVQLDHSGNAAAAVGRQGDTPARYHRDWIGQHETHEHRGSPSRSRDGERHDDGYRGSDGRGRDGPQGSNQDGDDGSTSQPALRVATDKADYAPGSTATFTVSGVEIGGTVSFQIADDPSAPGLNGITNTYTPFSAVDGAAGDTDGAANGTVVSTWLLPADGSATGATLNLVVESDERTASTTFTDSPNRIAIENLKPGTSQSYWNVAQSNQIEGFTTDFSINAGQTVDFKINVNGTASQVLPYKIEIFRLGYYGGDGATLVTTISNADGTVQPDPLYDASRALKDAGNWLVTDSWQIPTNAVSGVYYARLQRLDGNGDPIADATNHIPFIVRNDGAYSDIVLQTSDTTWQSYNGWWGNNGQIGANFYGDASGTVDHPDVASPGLGAQNRAYALSYNRPFLTKDPASPASGGRDYLFGADFAAIHWLEQNGYDVSYMSGIDTDRLGTSWFQSSPGNLLHKAYISVGHDEYWSGAQRANVEAARDSGVNLLFWSGNEVYWKTRYDGSIAPGGGTDYRTLVSYKETWANGNPNAAPGDYANIDPSNEWTGTWRDLRFVNSTNAQGVNTATGARPENSLTGQLFGPDGHTEGGALDVPQAYANLRYWRGTEVANSNGTFDISPGIIGYEWNVVADDANRPAGLIKLSETTLAWPRILVDQGNRTEPGTATHNLSLYRDDSGALVFGAGTVFWTWGLSNEHSSDPYAAVAEIANPAIQQFTVNLFADMGIQPTTLQASLTLATASTDNTPATTTLQNLPTQVNALQPITISGVATDIDGNAATTDGAVALVEISLDGGATWRPAPGGANWTYQWTPTQVGTYDIRARAIDDSLNIPVTATLASDTVIVAPPSSLGLFSTLQSVDGVLNNDSASLELGTRFQTTEAGSITALRYYRAPGDAADTDVREGHLWSSTGTLLGTVTFNSAPGASGWQIAQLAAPVQVTPNSTYVVSYHTENNYLARSNFFSTPFADPFGFLTAPSSGNGVFASGSGPLFPSNSFRDTNYWADVIFNPSSTTTVFDSNSTTNAVLENAAIGTAVGITALDGSASGITYSLTNNAGERFAIHPTTGIVTVAGSIDREASGSSLGIIVAATSGSGTSTGVFNIAIGDVDEFNVAPATDTNLEANTIWINAPIGTPVGITALAVDADATNSAITYSLSDNAGGRFAIGAANGIVTVANPSLLNQVATHQITVLATSADGSNSSQNFQVPVSTIPSSISLFNPQTPVTAGVFNDSASLELGVKFQASEGGIVTSLSYYRGVADSADTDIRAGHLWDGNGNLLASVTFNSAPGASGWQTAALSNPVALAANTTYVASYHTENNYVAQQSFFSGPYTGVFGTLSAPGGANGTYAYGPGALFPANSFASTNYWVDVRFTPIGAAGLLDTNSAADAVLENTAVGSTVGITTFDGNASGTTYSLLNNAGGRFAIDATTGVVTVAAAIDRESAGPSQTIVVAADGAGGTRNAIFDIAIGDADEFDAGAPADANAAANGTWLRAPTGTLVGITAQSADQDATNSSITYSLADNAGGRFAINAATGVVSVANSTLLDQVSNYQITVQAASADGSLALQTFSVPISPIPAEFGLFAPQAPVTSGTFSDGASVELGVRFQSSQDGLITGLKYYRTTGDAGDTDIRPGHLWDAQGNLLATVTFNSAPGASGWQVASLSNPVAIAAGTNYIASYHTENNYTAQSNFFTSSFSGVFGTLSAPAGGNGLYGYGANPIFPTNSLQGTNYWVDVNFTTALPPSISIALNQDSGAPGDLLTNVAAMSGITTPGATVGFVIDGVTSGSTVVADSGTGAWSFTPAGLGQGAHTVVARVTNTSGLTGSASLSFTFDSVAPSIDIQSAGGTVTNSQQTIQGTGEAGSTVQLFEGATQIGSTAIVAPSGNWSIPVTFATTGTHVLTARTTDAAGNVRNSASNVSYVYNINTLPSINGGDLANYSTAENSTLVATVSAVDPDVSQVVTYSITGGVDAALFEIRNGSQLHFRTAPDFEAPTDSGANNGYDLVISASDGDGGFDTQTIAVTVTNQNGITLTADTATITGTPEADVLTGLGSVNTILGLGGNDSLTGGGNNDTLEGGAGNDSLSGGTGIDTTRFSGSVNDYAFSYNSTSVFADTRAGAPDGTDQLTTMDSAAFSDGTFTLFLGTNAGNSLFGTASTTVGDLMLGYSGADFMSADAGNDFLYGGAGRDTLAGGAGSDTFIFQAASNSGATATTRDIINDFVSTAQNASVHDFMDLADIDANSTLAGNQAFAWGGTTAIANGIWYQQSGAGTTAITVVSGDTTGDSVADFQIQLARTVPLAATDIWL